MSTSYNNRKKAKKNLKSDEHKAIIRDIRQGKFPRFYLAKENVGTNRLESRLTLSGSGRVKNKLTFRLLSSLKALLGLSEKSSKEIKS